MCKCVECGKKITAAKNDYLHNCEKEAEESLQKYCKDKKNIDIDLDQYRAWKELDRKKRFN